MQLGGSPGFQVKYTQTRLTYMYSHQGEVDSQTDTAEADNSEVDSQTDTAEADNKDAWPAVKNLN